MGKYTLTIILVFSYIISLVAQDYIMLDGKKIPTNDPNLFKGRGYEVEIPQNNDEPILKSAGVKNKQKITSQRVFASKDMRSFAQSTIYEHTDSTWYYFPETRLSFFDKNGKKKWEKKFEKKITRSCYLSPDGDKLIASFRNDTTGDPTLSYTSLTVFDSEGNIFCDHPKPVEFDVSRNNDLVCYKEDVNETGDVENLKTFYVADLKSNSNWAKTYENPIIPYIRSQNGNYIVVWSWADSIYSVLNRNGDEVFKMHRSEIAPGRINEFSNDGRYALVVNEGYYIIIDVEKGNIIKLPFNLEVLDEKVFNGGRFIKNSDYLLVFSTVLALNGGTGAIVIYDITGNCLGYKLYDNQTSFSNPNVLMKKDGSFDVTIDGYDLGNLKLEFPNIIKYYKE